MLNYHESSDNATRDDYLELVQEIYKNNEYLSDLMEKFEDGKENITFGELLKLGDKNLTELILKIYNMRQGVLEMHETLMIMVNSCVDVVNTLQTAEKLQTIEVLQMELRKLSNNGSHKISKDKSNE